MGIDVTSLYNRRADNRWDRCAIGDVFERVATVSPEAEAIVGTPGAYGTDVMSRLTYGTADEWANRFANALLTRGLQRGDRVMLICENSVEAFIAKIGIAKAGGVVVPVNPSQTADVLKHAATLTEPHCVVADAESCSYARSAGIVVDVIVPIGALPADRGPTFGEFCEGSSSAPPEVTIHGDDIWQILFTSGTTALPKGVMVSHIYAHLAALSWVPSYTRGLRHESQLRTACFLPIAFHVGDQAYALPALFAGGTLILGRRYRAAELAGAIAAERATAVIGGTADTARRLLNELESLGPEEIRTLKCLVYGGPMDPQLINRFTALLGDINMIGLAGQTESVTAHRFLPTVFDDVNAAAFQRGANVIGKPTPLLASRLAPAFDPDETVESGMTGELLYRSPVLTAGYYRDEQATRKAFAEGWFHSEDLAYTQQDGNRVMVGRVKDMIKSGGENVASELVEHVVGQHPAVDKVAVIGVPDARWGESVTAIVVATAGAIIDEAAIIGYSRKRLAGFETPKRVIAVDALPSDFSGKVRKSELRKKFSGPTNDDLASGPQNLGGGVSGRPQGTP